jgi:hypothetical protein
VITLLHDYTDRTDAKGYLFGKIMKFRRAQTNLVDHRVRLLTEIINSIRAVKLYAYEGHFGQKVSEMRNKELSKLRSYALVRSSVNGFFFVAPIFATICE